MRFLFLLIIIFPLQAIACAYSTSSEMRHQELKSLISYLTSFDYGVDSATLIWRTYVYPAYPEYDSNYQAIIDTAPILSENNYKYYTRFKCARNKEYERGELRNVWTCNTPENRRIIDILDPRDRIEVDLDVNLDSKNVEELITYVRKQIIIDEAGRYKYMQYRGEKISDAALDITSLIVKSDGFYTLYLGGTEGCEVHYITVQVLNCSDNDCKYKIINNELVHLL